MRGTTVHLVIQLLSLATGWKNDRLIGAGHQPTQGITSVLGGGGGGGVDSTQASRVMDFPSKGIFPHFSSTLVYIFF